MSIETIHLRKLLQLIFASNSLRTRLLREDIRSDISRERGESLSGGGDFYAPFWADVRRHIAGHGDLRVMTEDRIEQNSRRARLYPQLRDGSLQWWEHRRRQRHEPYRIIDESLHGRHNEPGIGTIKVESTLAFNVGEDRPRVVYPYFSEQPILPEIGGRLGLWVMSKCISGYALGELRVLDIIRGHSISISETPFNGHEQRELRQAYQNLHNERSRLRDDYE